MRNAQSAQSGKDFTLPLIGAIFVHVIVITLLFSSWQFSYRKSVDFQIPPHIQAELVSLAKPEPKPEPAKQVVSQPKKTVSKPKPAPKPQSKPAVKEKVVPKPNVAPVATVKEPVKPAAEVAAAASTQTPESKEQEPVAESPTLPSEEALFKELMAGSTAEDAKINKQVAALEQMKRRETEITAQVQIYAQSINTQIAQKWSRPRDQLTDVSSLKAEVLVELMPSGELSNVTLTKSSGNAMYDQSVVRAIEKVRRFDVPEDPEVFEKGDFRHLRVTFTPEDFVIFLDESF